MDYLTKSITFNQKEAAKFQLTMLARNLDIETENLNFLLDENDNYNEFTIETVVFLNKKLSESNAFKRKSIQLRMWISRLRNLHMELPINVMPNDKAINERFRRFLLIEYPQLADIFFKWEEYLAQRAKKQV